MNEEDWDKFIQEHQDSNFFHQLSWKKVIENVYGFKPYYIIAKGLRGLCQPEQPPVECSDDLPALDLLDRVACGHAGNRSTGFPGGIYLTDRMTRAFCAEPRERPSMNGFN